MRAYIRQELFGDNAKPRKALRRTQIDDQKVSPILSIVGESRLSSNLNQLTKKSNMGNLDMFKEAEEEVIPATRHRLL